MIIIIIIIMIIMRTKYNWNRKYTITTIKKIDSTVYLKMKWIVQQTYKMNFINYETIINEACATIIHRNNTFYNNTQNQTLYNNTKHDKQRM